MARGAEACAAMVARADLRLAEAAVPDRPRHADISRSDLSQSLCSDARRAEEGADGTVAYKAADASRPRAARPRMDRGTTSIWSTTASDPPRPRIAPFLAIGKEIFLPEQATRTSRRSSNATAALRCSSSFQGRTRRLWWPRSLSTSANCPSSYDAP